MDFPWTKHFVKLGGCLWLISIIIVIHEARNCGLCLLEIEGEKNQICRPISNSNIPESIPEFETKFKNALCIYE